jgi:hypothetical protein
MLFGVKETESNQNRILTSAEKISKNRSTSTNFKTYEKVTKDAFCYGEFCPYQVPKFFKNLKKTREDEINVTNV